VTTFIERENGSRRRTALLLAFVCVASGCAPRWTLRTAQPAIALQWPYQPSKAKVTYVQSLTGLAQDKSSASVLSAIVFGADEEDRNAFVLPVAVATGSDGRIAVADMGRRCVHLYIPKQQRYVQLVGSEREAITSPVGVIFDEELRLYLSDSAGKVFVFDQDGALLFTVQKAGADTLQRPTGIAYSPRKKLLYVVDTLAHKVHAFGKKGDLAFSFGERGDGEGRFNFPTHIFWSTSGELYVTDALNFRVEIFDEQGKALGSFGRHGDGSGDLAMPKGVAVDRDGIVYVVDGIFDNVQLFNRQGDFLLTLGSRGVDFGAFWLPSGAFISESNELYVCDTYNRRIQVFRITERYADGTS
jgi:DNA-binding beta-propeller fold protein YncE